MKYSQRTVTNAGADLLANALQEEKSVVIDSIVISDVILPADKDLKTVQLSDITSYLNFPVIYIKKPDLKTIQPGCRISNYDVPVNNETSKYLTNIHQVTNDDGTTGSAGDLASNFAVNTVACLGHIDGDANDTLIDVAVADTGEAFQMDAATEIVFRLFFDFAVKIENDLSNDNIIINVNNAGAITYEDLENEIQKLHNDYVSLNGDNTINGTKNFVGSLQYNGSDVATASNISSLANSATKAIRANSEAIYNVSATSNQNSLLASEALSSMQTSLFPVVHGVIHGNLASLTSNGIYNLENSDDVTGLPSDYPTGNSGNNAVLRIYTPFEQTPHYELEDYNGNQWLGTPNMSFAQSGSSFIPESVVAWTRQLNASDVNSLGSAANGANSATGVLSSSVSANSSAISSVANSASSAVTSLSSATSSGLSSLAANASSAVLYNGSLSYLGGMQSDGVWFMSSNNGFTNSTAVVFTKKLGSSWNATTVAAMIDSYGNFFTGYTTIPYEGPVMSQMATQSYASSVTSSAVSTVSSSASSAIGSLSSAMFKYQSVYVGDFHSIWSGYSDGYYQVNSSNVQNLPSGFSGTGVLHRINDGAGHFNFTLFDDYGNQWYQSYDSNSFTWSGWQETATQSFASSTASSAVQSVTNTINNPAAFGGLMQAAFANDNGLYKDNNAQMQAYAQSNGFDYPAITQNNCHFSIPGWQFQNLLAAGGLPTNITFYADFYNFVLLNMSIQLILTNVGDIFYRVTGKQWSVLVRASY